MKDRGYGNELQNEDTYISDSEVNEWCEEEKIIELYVCSTCGLIANETINHRNCGLQDWWIINVKCINEEATTK